MIVKRGGLGHCFIRGRNGKWFGTGRRAIRVAGVGDPDELVVRICRESVQDLNVVLENGRRNINRHD